MTSPDSNGLVPGPIERHYMKLLLATLVTATTLVLSGCAAANDDAPSGPPVTSSAGQVDDVLATHQLGDLKTVDLVERLDRLAGKDRPSELMASVRPDRLVLTAGGDEVSLDLPTDRFYLSVAPYVSQTHDCFNHSLTTCTGELADTQVQVKVVDRGTGKVLMDEQRSTFANGFVGVWLPRDIKATLTVTAAAGRASADITTEADAPTCLTTLKLT